MSNILSSLFKSTDLEQAGESGDVRRVDLATLAAEQGVQPADFDALVASASFWPEDESVDEFIHAVHDWRNDEP